MARNVTTDKTGKTKKTLLKGLFNFVGFVDIVKLPNEVSKRRNIGNESLLS